MLWGGGRNSVEITISVNIRKKLTKFVFIAAITRVLRLNVSFLLS